MLFWTWVPVVGNQGWSIVPTPDLSIKDRIGNVFIKWKCFQDCGRQSEYEYYVIGQKGPWIQLSIWVYQESISGVLVWLIIQFNSLRQNENPILIYKLSIQLDIDSYCLIMNFQVLLLLNGYHLTLNFRVSLLNY